MAHLIYCPPGAKQMNHAVHNKIVSFICSIADGFLRDIYVREKFRDIILPMVMLRCLDSLLGPSKDAVLKKTVRRTGTVQTSGRRYRIQVRYAAKFKTDCEWINNLLLGL